MGENGLCYASLGDFVDKILDAGAHGTITQESALRLIFLARKAGTKGYTWWKRIKLAEHWGVHKTTITRDYEKWPDLGFVKLRPNPFKGSAKLVIFPRSKVWDDAVWEDPKEVASMLPDLRESFRQKRREGCTRATQKGRTDATYPAGSTITENLKDKNVKQQQPSAGPHKQSATSVETPPKAPGDPRRQADEGACPPPSCHRDEETVEGFSDMRALLARYHVRVQPGEIQALIEAGRRQDLTLEGILSFVGEKLKQKRDQNDPVFSAKLLIKAISDEADLHHWALKRQGCNSFFEQRPTRAVATPFSVAELRDYLSAHAQQLRQITGYPAIVAEIDLLAADAEAKYSDLEALEQRLNQLEADVIAIAQSHQTDADAMQARQELDKELRPYPEKMTKEQITALESGFLERKLLEHSNLPRPGLFYLGHQWGQAA
jgi:hypothetical protein